MKLNHITILVSDIQKSKKFYKDILNLDCTFEEQIQGEQFSKITGYKNLKLKFAVLKIPNTDVILELAQFMNPEQKINNDFRHIAFEVDDVDKIFKRVKQNNCQTISPPLTIKDKNPKLNGKRFFYFNDPDGNLIEILKRKDSLYSSNSFTTLK